jgi:phosphate transport system substrate-binding protein
LSLPQVDAIFSKTRRLGHAEPINTWGDLALTGVWADRAISLYGRNSASGTYGYFKDHALGGGDFRDAVKEQPGSSSVVQAVGSDPSAIGYSGSGYKTSDVRAIPLSAEEGETPVAPDPQNAFNGTYPLARYLWLTVNYRPGSELDPLTREFVRFVLSRQGQQSVIEDGYLPLPAATAKQALEMVGIQTTH